MKNSIILAGCLIALLIMAGCKGVGSAADGGGSLFAGGSSIIGGGSSGGDGGSGGTQSSGHTPEPTTVALLGSGFAAYAFLKRKKKK